MGLTRDPHHRIDLNVTPLILTYNEAPNIQRALENLVWAKNVILLDSFSTDSTLEIARLFPNVTILQRPFDNHTDQWNFGLEACATPWVLALDADYILSEGLVEELKAWEPGAQFAAFYAKFRYWVNGRALRGTLYPPRAVLFRRDRCRYKSDGHTQLLRIEGEAGWLNGVINHDDRKPLSRWVWAQDRYAVLEASKLLETAASHLSLRDRLRRAILPAPPVIFFYTLFGKGLILDGWPGCSYALQRTFAELLLSLHLLERKLTRTSKTP